MSNAMLTPRETRFVQEFLVDACGAKAAIRAGVAPSGAHVWASRALRKTKVFAALQARQSADASRLHIQRENVVAALLEAVATAREQKDPMGVVAGWREIAKLLGLYPRAQVNLAANTASADELQHLYSLTDQQLQTMIAKDNVEGG